ncbi:hypothetical protein K439DRAFT_1615090 [Ramaria rubella]|nr:hypothetical protein K439DRAFT_1615090 [Ramaria rubella]
MPVGGQCECVCECAGCVRVGVRVVSSSTCAACDVSRIKKAGALAGRSSSGSFLGSWKGGQGSKCVKEGMSGSGEGGSGDGDGHEIGRGSGKGERSKRNTPSQPFILFTKENGMEHSRRAQAKKGPDHKKSDGGRKGDGNEHLSQFQFGRS